MKEKIKRIVVTLVAIFFINYSIKLLAETKVVTKKVLIVAEKRYFNDPVFSKVINILKKEGCYVGLSSQKRIRNSTTKKFNAVVIILSSSASLRSSSEMPFLVVTTKLPTTFRRNKI